MFGVRITSCPERTILHGQLSVFKLLFQQETMWGGWKRLTVYLGVCLLWWRVVTLETWDECWESAGCASLRISVWIPNSTKKARLTRWCVSRIPALGRRKQADPWEQLPCLSSWIGEVQIQKKSFSQKLWLQHKRGRYSDIQRQIYAQTYKHKNILI